MCLMAEKALLNGGRAANNGDASRTIAARPFTINEGNMQARLGVAIFVNLEGAG